MGREIISLEEGYRLRVSPDGLEAWLEAPPGKELSPRVFYRFRSQLEDLGLRNFLDPPVREGSRLIVARGQPPRHGEDGRIEFLIDLSRGPREVSPHRVDWREVNALVSVPAGTAVARVLPPTPGVPGLTVWGEPIPPKPGHKLRLRKETSGVDEKLRGLEEELEGVTGEEGRADLVLGPGLRYDPEKELILAEEGGFLEIQQRRLRIHPVYTLRGDVDWNTGNIHFHGRKLTVTGSVKRGFQVEVQGDLEIRGNVEDGVRIRTGGHLTVGGIVKGAGTSVEAGGNAILNIVEQAVIKVKGNLTVTGYLLQTRAMVGGSLSVLGEKGLVGGETFVEGSGVVSVAGNPAFVRTVVRVGFSYEVAEEVYRLEREFDRLDQLTDQMKEALVQGIRMAKEGRLSPRQKKILGRLYRVLKEKLLEMAEIKERMASLEEELERGAMALLQITRWAYPNVLVGVGRHTLLLQKEYGPGVFALEGARIVYRG